MNKMDIINAEEFKINNGKVLRTINILRHTYNKLKTIYPLLKSEDINETAFMDAVNFLHLEGYIEIRITESKMKVDLADHNDYKDLEARLTGKGIRLLAGGIEDNMIEV